MTFTIRRMNITDVESVYDIELSAHKAPWTKAILQDCILVGYDCYVLEIDSQIIGYIICRLTDEYCHILNIGIAPRHQSKGWGKQLLQYMIDSIRTIKQIKTVMLEVRPSNVSALHLYFSMGFQQVAIKKDYYKDPLDVEDAIVLEKNLYE